MADAGETADSGGWSGPRTRALKIVVVGLGVILIFGFLLLLSLIAYRAVNPLPRALPGKPAMVDVAMPIWTETARMALPRGSVIRGVSLGERRIAVHYGGSGGEGIIVLDAATGQVLGRAEATSGP